MVKIAEEIIKFKNNEINADDLYDSLRWSTEEIKENVLDQYRWQILYEWIVKDEEDRYWKFSRLRGSTEYQDDDDFDGEVIEVEPYKKTIIDYRVKSTVTSNV